MDHSMKKTLVLLGLLVAFTQAGVLHREEESDTTTLQAETTTAEAEQDTTTIPTPLTKDVKFNRELEEAFETVAHSRDIDATVHIPLDEIVDDSGETSGGPKFEAITIEFNKSLADGATQHLERSAKLLLLSTPKLHEKPREQEENIEEPEELIVEAEMSTTTVAPEAEETTTTMPEEEEATNTELPGVTITKLYPINDTLYANSKDEEKSIAIPPSDSAEESKPSNFGSTILIESESDYVVVDSDVEQLSSYTDVDSEVHLQPIVQSVEIVPSSVDDSLLVNYVQSW